MADELDAVPESGKQTVNVEPFGSLPILILSRDPEVIPPNWPPPLAKDIAVVWTQMQEETKSLSTDSRRIVAKGSDHYVQLDRPELVINEVSGLVKRLRGNVSDVPPLERVSKISTS